MAAERDGCAHFEVVLAALALLISLFHLYVAYVPAPQILTWPPEQVLMKGVPYRSRGEDIVHFGAQRSYVNERRFGQNAVLVREELTIRVGKRRFREFWQYQGDFVGTEGEQKDRLAVHPLVLEPSHVISHETEFAPRKPDVNYVPWATFVDEFEQAGGAEFCFVGLFHEDICSVAACRIQAAPRLVEALRLRAVAPSCVAVEPPEWCRCPES